MSSSFSSHHKDHDDRHSSHHLSDGFADHLDLEAAVSRSMTENALSAATAALDTEPTRILDLGAGTGVGTLALARQYPSAHVDSLDLSADLLARLEASAASAGVSDRVDTHVVDLDGEWSGVIPAQVDLIWASMSLHHVRHPDDVLRRAFQALRPGGVLVITEMTPEFGYSPEDLGSGVAGLTGRLVTELTAAGHPSASDWSRELAEAGFESLVRRDHTVTVTGDTAEGARYLQGQLRAWSDRFVSVLSPADRSGLDRAITGLDAGTSTVVHTSGRAIWTAVRPADPAAPAVRDAEVVVVGGGAAGLAASIVLARSRRRVALIDAGQPRNARAHGAHNLLGNEGIPPLELLARGREEAEHYGVQILSGHATSASGTIDNFTVEIDGGATVVHARRVILASGLIDELPDIPGVREAWGESVLHCAFCHGWEVRDQRIGILARDERAIHHAMLFRQLSDDVTLFLNGAADLTPEQLDQLAALNVPVVRPRVERLIVDGSQVKAVRVDGGIEFPMDAFVVAPLLNVRTELFEELGGEPAATTLGRHIPADPLGGTAVPGVFTAGNAGEPMTMLVASAASGVTTGSAVHGQLAAADLADAVAARKRRIPHY